MNAHAWLELNTANLGAAKSFYTGLFGWSTNDMDMGEYGAYTMFGTEASPDSSFAGLVDTTTEMGAMLPSGWVIYFNVDDVDAAVAKVTATGGTAFGPAFDIPSVGRAALVADPQGNKFYLFKSSNPA
ncbi:MAG: VOC family protein [Chthonomonas sp.]|nr:VOC family protein [Chthonomonas sp.]